MVFEAPSSKKGVSISVFEHCVKGICSCKHVIGSDNAQPKPCRFAALLFASGRIPSEDEKKMYDGIVDGFDIVSAELEVEGYDNSNYLSILPEECKPKMDQIVKGEIENGILEVVNTKPKCIHSLGAAWGRA